MDGWMMMYAICMLIVFSISDVNDCHSAPCLNGGTCIDKVRQFQCICAAGWDGATCQNSEPPSSTFFLFLPFLLLSFLFLLVQPHHTGMLLFLFLFFWTPRRRGRVRLVSLSERRNVSGPDQRLSLPVFGRLEGQNLPLQ